MLAAPMTNRAGLTLLSLIGVTNCGTMAGPPASTVSGGEALLTRWFAAS